MRLIIPILGCLALGACATVQDPPIRIQTVNVPLPVSCVPKDLPPPAAYPDTPAVLLAAPNAVERARLLEEGWGLRDVRLSLLEKLIDACRG